MAVLLITHYQRMLNYITPDFVHVMVEGRIIRSGRRGAGARAGGEGVRVGARARGGERGA
jgi:Fe-S cluster assembly ATP-binding protein